MQNLDIYAQVGANAALVKTITRGRASPTAVLEHPVDLRVGRRPGDRRDRGHAVLAAPPPPPPPLDQLRPGRRRSPGRSSPCTCRSLPTGNVLVLRRLRRGAQLRADLESDDRHVHAGAVRAKPLLRRPRHAGRRPDADRRRAHLGRRRPRRHDDLRPDDGHVDAAPDMSVGRWYPTATELPDGRVLVVLGRQHRPGPARAAAAVQDASVNSLPEIFDPATNTWTDLTGSRLTTPLYPFMFVLSNGKVFDAGPDTTTRILDPATVRRGRRSARARSTA